MALQKEVWVAGIQENPVPDTSFVFASQDKSEFVDNNKLHLAEAGIEPTVYKNYFASTSDPLPVANIQDIPNEVLLNTYSTAQTLHRNLEEVELQYNRRDSIIARHKAALAKNIGKEAAYMWTPAASNTDNKLLKLGSGSIIDAITDIRVFFMEKDLNMNLNLCLTPEHWGKIKKEDAKLYKDLMAMKDREYSDFKIWTYSQNPLFTSAGVKKPFGAAAESTDQRASFFWCSDETFRSFGTTEMYSNIKDSGLQADTLSFAQRALVGNIRANAPKFFAGIINS